MTTFAAIVGLGLLAAAAVAALAIHLIIRYRYLRVEIRLDPDDPDPKLMAECMAQVAVRLDEHPERMRLAIYGSQKGGVPVVIDLVEGGAAFRITAGGHRSRRLDLRRRWIAEHPVPLEIMPGRCKVLYVVPVDANRFRVSHRLTFALGGALQKLKVDGSVMGL